MNWPAYTEPPLAVLVLDFAKPIETRVCLESVRRHIRVHHTVILCDNGSGEDYPLQFVREGLADQLIVNRHSRGLGLGTRDLFAASFAPHSLYLQNDQVLVRDLTIEELRVMTHTLQHEVYDDRGRSLGCARSISLAGYPCGPGVYSERAHLIYTDFYKAREEDGILGYHGAGPYHDGPWREEQMQRHYREMGYTHYAWPNPLVQDNGVYAVRDMGEGGLWCHRTDTKRLWCIQKPTGPCNPAYPKFTDFERGLAETGGWPDGQIPEQERAHSFDCWSRTTLGRRQDDYIADLRRRKGSS